MKCLTNGNLKICDIPLVKLTFTDMHFCLDMVYVTVAREPFCIERHRDTVILHYIITVSKECRN